MNKRSTSQKSFTEFERLDTMKDEDIDFSDCPELTPDMFARAVVRKGLKPISRKKIQLTIRIDTDVLEWYKSQGKGYQTLINELLRAYMDAQLQSQLPRDPI
ncbi:BrnA antitoxin family protein [candidate division CSSED10-310 bacterium]|uniref:BrnA antitoxin family protein n=1 Tax=candidate division CSSED10-310 bacterium TaxID=2855610 RepID=A0ABV6Z2H9_UNCC1